MLEHLEYFKDKVALVTGASSGIGYGIAVELHRLGAKVYGTGRSVERLDKLKQECPGINVIPLDLSDWKKTEELLGDICKSVDFLVNNAGTGTLQEMHLLSEEDVDSVYRTNLKAPMNLIRLAAPGMKERRFGSIVNISSDSSLAAQPAGIVYCSSKSALDAMMKVAALELAPYNVRVNSICPALVKTPIADVYLNDPTLEAYCLSLIPMRRFIEIDEVVQPVIQLLSDESSMITGIQLPVDGGFTAT